MFRPTESLLKSLATLTESVISPAACQFKRRQTNDRNVFVYNIYMRKKGHYVFIIVVYQNTVLLDFSLCTSAVLAHV